MAFRPFVFASASCMAICLATSAQAQTTSANDGVGEEPDTRIVEQPVADEPVVTNPIVVTGVRASIVGALNVRRDSTQIVDSVVAEDVGKLPDNNVVEALQRVTGIQVTDRAGGEAATVTIRGLPDPLTTLNGRNIFTAAGQSFALQDISANLVKQVNVYKTRSADQIETGLAGQIDVRTRRPLDFDGFAISGLARGIYNEQADSYNPNVALLISDRFETGIGEIGVLVNASYAKTDYRNMSTTAGALIPFATENPPAGSGLAPLERIFPGEGNVNWQPGLDAGLPTAPGSTLSINGVDTPYYLSRDAVFNSDLYGERERPAVNAVVQWQPNNSSVYTAEVFYAGFRGNTFNSLQFSFVDWWGNPGPVELYDGTNLIKSRVVDDVFGFNSGDYSTASTDSYVYALNGQWDVGTNGFITADIAYQDSTNETDFIAQRVSRTADQITVDFNAGDDIPSFHFADDSLLRDPSVWNVGELYDSAGRSEGSAFTVQIDGGYEWDYGFLRGVKAGFRYDNRDASTFTRTQDAAPIGGTLAELGEDAQFYNSDFQDGLADVPRSWVVANGYYLRDNADTVRALYGLPTSDTLELDRVFDINEVSMAAYALADTEVEIFGRPLQMQAGLRYVAVTTKSDFFDRLDNGSLTRASTGTEEFLPSFTARYELTDDIRLRFNYGETLRRPAFGDLNPNYTLTGDLTNLGYGNGTAGNADLEPTRSKNFDAAIEWYFERNSAIYVTAFRREIDGLVVPLTALTFIPDNDIVAGATDTFAITRPVNASSGVLKGVEAGLTYFPTYLPGFLDGLGFNGSLTVLDSNQNIPQSDSAGNIVGERQSEFFNVSNLSYNATLAYDRGPISTRLSYIWREEFLHNNETRQFANPIGIWYQPEDSLDFQLTVSPTDNIGITFDAVNLLKSNQQSYYKFEDAGGPERFNLGTLQLARTFALGVRFTFD
ncbi:TonB-dependent receptor [Croceicoccus hydrothermalis]|uniref:TonB-dependent receptor n=1 Tax=Croceicoccus hydrothermalis TaxID=2867964 RepID=UPI001EFBAF58|nr:TonB-dependent receptor [Croceicoccus hydrothermalis]